MTESRQGPLWLLRILSAIVLAVTSGIHLFLIFDGVGGLLGTLFVLNGIAGIVLAVGMLVLRGTWLRVATILSLLFLIASLAALLLPRAGDGRDRGDRDRGAGDHVGGGDAAAGSGGVGGLTPTQPPPPAC